MSFGWSAGDIISAIEVLYHVGKALKDSGDADERYKETGLFLEALAATLERVRRSDASVSIGDQVDALRAPVEKFCARLKRIRFEKKLGRNSPKDWQGQLRSLSKRERYELFGKVDVQEFKNEISAPLLGIQISLGLKSFRLLSELQSNLSDLQAASTSDIERLIESLLINYRYETQEPTRVKEVLQWVRPRGGRQMIDVYHDFRSGLLDGSCEWLFESAQYNRWRSNPEPSFLWITGIPGAGKTRLATRVVERLKSTEIVAYHFCDTNDSARCEFLNIIQTWVWQFLDQDKSKIDRVDSVRDSGAPPAEATMQDCLDHLVLSSDERKRVVILDGLDECPSEVRPKLCNLLVHLADRAKVLLFSRRLEDISDELGARIVAAKFEHFHISANDTEQDLTNFLETSVKKLRLSDQNLELRIINSLQAGADGMFQWAALMIDDLAQPGKLFEEDYLKILQDLPRGIDALYGRILDGLYKSGHCERSQKLLQWIVCSRRPLTLEEVGKVLTLDKDYFRGKKTILGLDLRQMVRQLCGPLVAIEVNDIERLSVVTLVHASAKDFLLDQSHKSKSFGALLIDSGEAHTQLAEACLATICNEKAEFLPLEFSESEVVSWTGAASEDRDKIVKWDSLRSIAQQRVDHYLNSFPLMMYAAANWLSHFTAAKECPFTCGYAGALHTSTRNTTRWLQLYSMCIRRHKVGSGSSTSVEDILQLATLRKTSAAEGQAALEDWLAHLRGPPHSRITRWNSFLYGDGHIFDFLPAVHVAAFFDFDDIVEKHLNKGGDVNIRTYCGLTPLCLAARGDSLKTVQVLLQAGAEINHGENFWASPLNLALDCHVNKNDSKIGCDRSGQLDVVRLLLDAGAQAYTTEEDIRMTGMSSLHKPCLYAVRNDTTTLELVDMLLAHGGKGNLDSRRLSQHDVPLQCAARRGVPELVDLFLRNGADCESRCSVNTSNHACTGHRTALLIACCKESANMDVIRILLEAGASVKAKCHDGRTALHMAAAHPPELAELLLTHGAEVDAVSADGSLPIHEAVREHNFLLVKALVNHGSQLDAKDGNGLSPLAIALGEGFDDATEVLIQAGAEPEPGYGPRGESNEKTHETASQFSSTNTPPHEPEPGYWPRDYSDQFAAFRLLRRPGIGVKLPEHLVLRILDLAEYWVKSIVSCSDAKAVDEHTSIPSETYVRSATIRGRRENPVQKVRFVTRSHDQGWSSDVSWNHGTYRNCWTWFDIQIVKRSGRLVDFRLNLADDNTADCQELIRNVHAKWESTEHEIVYGNGPGYRRCEWIDWLKPGEQLGITPMALYRGWVNHIEFAQIEVFSTSLGLRVEEVRASEGNTTVACNEGNGVGYEGENDSKSQLANSHESSHEGNGVGYEGENDSKSQLANSHESSHEVRLDEVRSPEEVRSVSSGVPNTEVGQGDKVGKVWFWIIPMAVGFFAWGKVR